MAAATPRCAGGGCNGTASLRSSQRCIAAFAAKGAGKAPSSKGFGAAKPSERSDGCPCGSGAPYKTCCKPYVMGVEVAPSVEATVRARFSAILKKQVSYLLTSTHPDFHSVQYGTEPGGALRRLQDDFWNTCEHYEYSNLKLHKVVPGDTEDEAIAVFQYAVYDKRTPLLDDAGNKARKVQVEQARFLRAGDEGGWQFVDVKLVEVPEALAKVAEQQARDMAAAAGQPGKQQPSP